MQPMYYVGLDIHKRKISYCVKNGQRPDSRRGFDFRHTFGPGPLDASNENFRCLDRRRAAVQFPANCESRTKHSRCMGYDTGKNEIPCRRNSTN